MGELLKRYILELNKLKTNDAVIIQRLTDIANQLKDSDFVHPVAHKTYKNALKAPPAQKLFYLYVMDSIVKNVGDPYVKIFAKNLVHVFERVFLSMENEEGRKKMYKLRITWKPIFNNDNLYLLDRLIQQIDPKWPMVSKPPSSKPLVVERPVYDKNASLPTVTERKQDKRDIIVESDPLEPPCIAVRVPVTVKQSPPPAETKPVLASVNLRDPRLKRHMVPRDPRLERSTTPPQIKPPSTLLKRKSEELFDAMFSLPKAIKPSIESEMKPSRISEYSETTRVASPRVSHEVDVPMEEIDLTEERVLIKPEPSSQKHQAPVIQISQHTAPTNLEPIPAQVPDLAFPKAPSPPSFVNWRVEIEGFDYADIGIDPRLLNLVPQPKRNTFIQILGKRYTLHLERIHPLINMNASFHAIRFRTNPVPILLNERLFLLPSAGYCRVFIHQRPYEACLGAPVHELIIDGIPHNVPFNNSLTYINVDGHQVTARFPASGPKNIEILPPIPPNVLQFAACNLFGSARFLKINPTNPLDALRRQRPRQGNILLDAVQGGWVQSHGPPAQPYAALLDSQSQTQPMVHHLDENISDATQAVLQPQNLPYQPQQERHTKAVVNMNAFFQKLVKSGIITQASITPEEIDLNSFSISLFKKPNKVEMAALYHGFQCVQCGQRFSDVASEEYKVHLDYHFLKNSLDVSGARQRQYYPEMPVWLMGKNNALANDASLLDPGQSHESSLLDTNLTLHIARQQDFRCKASKDPLQNICAVCKEGFGEQVWDDDEDDWMLVNAIRENDQLFHPVCMDDAGKEILFVNDTTDEAKLDTKIKEEAGLPKMSSPKPVPADDNASMTVNGDGDSEVPKLHSTLADANESTSSGDWWANDSVSSVFVKEEATDDKNSSNWEIVPPDTLQSNQYLD